ncbi:MAG: glucose/galactose transporter [Bacteroidota bacterium]|jgi:glucose/galactose transporter
MTTNHQSPAQYRISITIIGILFFIFGFVTWVNGTLIPYLKIACELESEFQSFLVVTAFFIAYTVMAIPSSIVLSRVGYKKGMSLGLFIMAAGAGLFIPAAQSRDFNMFLGGLFIIGTGLALLQTASNPYVSIIGPIESAASRISIMGISNKFAGIIAGLIFGAIALSDVDGLEARLATMDAATKAAELDALAARVINPYIIITVVLVILGIGVLFSPLPDINDEADDTTSSESNGKTSIFQFPHLFLGVLAIFCYVGVEVMAGDTIISYGKALGIELSTARYFTSATLTFMVLGYIVGVFAIPKYLSQEMALKVTAIMGVVFTIAAVLLPGYYSVASIALLGLANSLIWPAIFPLGIEGLGKFTKTGSALLIMGIAGGAILPLVYGKLAEIIGNQQAYLLMLPCYIYILYFAIKGHRVGRA